MLAPQIHSQTVLIDYSSSWFYYDNANQPSDNNGFDWNDINYDASAWNQGNAQLGYGDSDENTVINANTKTAYFRQHFNITDPSVYEGVELNLIYDDGAVVYLNGTEVWRINMPSGTITYNTFASSTSSDNANAFMAIANSLVTGDNVLAVEIHQRSNTSSDLSFDFEATATMPGASSIIRGPYLQKASATNMTIRWRTSSTTESIIKYGTDINDLNQIYSNTTPKTEHIADISGLSPNTTYYYRIENSAAILLPEATDLYFKTHPTIGTNQPITMWILGDCGTANNNQRAVRDAYYNYIGNNHTDGILFLGDNAYNDGTDQQYQNAVFNNMYEDKLQNSIAWSCLGNHDGFTANSNSQTGPYYDIFSFPTAGESGGVPSGTEAYYSFDYGNIHFIALESYETDRSVGGAMYNWAISDIQSTTQQWIVAYWHHPPYTKGSHDSDSESNLIDMRENFLPMLESNGVDLVLSGHSHSYERSYFLNGHYGDSNSFDAATHTVGATGNGNGQENGDGEYNKTITGPDAGEGAVYITTGSSGRISSGSLNHEAMYYSVSQLGSCVLEVNGNQLDVKFVRETGSIDDFFTIIKEEDCVVGMSCDDGDACTINDTYNSNCNCVGTSLPDSDNDGICDAEDQCPNLDNALIGTACDDGDSQTENDIYGNDCTCSGVPCSLAGTTCDDGDPSTFNDVTDGNCNCAGTPCPIAGTSCDDGDPTTINDVEDGFCNCEGTSITTTTCISINSSSDDAEEHGVNGSISFTSTDIEMVFDDFQSSGNQTVGLRFNSVDVPQGAIISNAYIQFTTDEINTGATNLTIVGEDVDNASPFTTTTNEITNRTKTQASASWNPPDWNLVGEQSAAQQTTDISSIIQEIVDRSGYAINNSMVIVITGTGERTAESYDGSPSQAAQLCIEYAIICPTQGNTCDDGDPCTTNDVIDANCNCIGVPLPDSDNDGICDAEDQCPNLDNALIGTACDDGDSQTENDIYGNDCTCSGVPCSLAGTTCDDGDPSTFNDVTDGNCNCAGTPCPIAGTSCDDGDPTTTNDVEDGFCNCEGTNITTTTCISINSSSDDAEEHGVNGSISFTSTDIEMVFDDFQSSGNQTVGLRFNSVDVPQGVIISNAYIQFTTDEINTGATNLTIVGEDVDNADPFTTTTNEITNRIKTQASASWNPPDWNLVGEQSAAQQTTDISSIIQEIVDRPGYAINNSMAIVITGTGERTAESYDGSPSQAAQLCIEYAIICQTQGNTCDDGDACTTNDVIDANCNCAGTFQDADGDGVCDANDICQGGDDNVDSDNDGTPDFCDSCDGNTVGNPCDDGDACTTNDVIDANCNCAGTFQDADGDGVCDANDICQGGDDNTDSDNDGTPDFCDSCDGNTVGNSCDDGDACTTNDVIDANCNCAGTFQDADGDGVCDANDICQGGDDNVDSDNDGTPDFCDSCDGNTVGNSCDDGDACTTNDVIDANCNCAGTFQDADGDGVCDANDICQGGDDNVDSDNDGTPDFCDSCDGNTVGNPCDDGDACTTNDVIDANCNCAGTFQDADGDGVCDANDICQGGDDNVDSDNDGTPDFCDSCDGNTVGNSCDDGDACTTNDVIDANCNCAGTFQDADGDGVCDANDICQGGDDNTDSDNDGTPDFCDSCDGNTVGNPCDDGDVCTTNDVIDANCNCAGTFQDADGDGVCDANDICQGSDDNQDSDGDGIPNGCDECDANTIGNSCDDGDACTTNDVIDTNCNCAGTFQDADGDGVCDANDICQGSDDNQDSDGDGIPNGCDDCDANTIGNSCDDGDVCTTNDVIDANCNCAGTFQDADGDGVCDANDICQGSDDNQDSDGDGIPNGCDECDANTIGNSCDDGDVCTTNDVIDANCNCAGTFQDADGDGVCDANDICQGSDDNQDSDGDGIPNGCDDCDANTIGNSCDDGDACTTNDVIDANCNCAGTFQDADGDGVCDANDICQGSDDNQDSDGDGIPNGCDECDANTIGNSCDDGDACTTNDVIDTNCNCAGTFQDADGDGVCDANDICQGSDDNQDSDGDGIPNGCDDCDANTIGNSCDDGDVCTTNDVIDANCNCAGTFQDADGDGVCDANDICQGNDDNQDSDGDGIPNGCDDCDANTIGNSCDDGDACTTNDVIDANCNCAGTFQDADGDGVCDANDICQGGDDNVDSDNDGTPDFCDSCDGNTVGNSCDDGDACTTNDVIDANCNCAGIFQDADGDGVCDANDICQGSDDNQDSDGDGIPNGCDDCDANTIGNSCDDGDACTTNDVIDANCNCAGTFQDADGDGVCDANDICQGGDDNTDSDNDGTPDFCDSCDGNTVGNSCDDGDVCTTNDVIDTNCNCVGIYQDNDNDGICVGNDPDDNDPCNPDCSSPACSLPCDEILNDSFENGFGSWNDGGGDCSRTTLNPNTGTYSVRLRDDSGSASAMTSDLLELSSYSELIIEFSYFPNSMENGEDFLLEISTNNGSSYTIYKTWVSGTDFNNGIRYDEQVIINDIVFSTQTLFRIRCDASGNGDQVYIDDVVVIGCTAEGAFQNYIGNSCDDGDPCTINDVIDLNCNCAGIYQDNDNDGICVGNDPDDDDACNPDSNSPVCSPLCDEILNDSFENGYGLWNDGGGDCTRRAQYPNTGIYSVRLRDDSGSASAMTSDMLDLTTYSELTFEFSYFPNSMENGEDFFLEISTNDGASYTIYRTWASGTDFNNGTRYDEVIVIDDITFTSQTRLRLRCDASGNGDHIFVDDVVVTACNFSNGLKEVIIDKFGTIVNGTNNSISSDFEEDFKSSATFEFENFEDDLYEDENEEEFNVYPNPTRNFIYVNGNWNDEHNEIELLDIYGQKLLRRVIEKGLNEVPQIDVSHLPSGIYIVNFVQSNEIITSQKVVITNN